MDGLLTYLLKSSFILLLFYGVYLFFLRKETFFTTNRWFLIIGILCAAFLPFIEFSKTVLVYTTEYDNIFVQPAETIILADKAIHWTSIAGYIYFAITGILIFRIFLQWFSFKKLVGRGKRTQIKGIRYVKISEKISPFSFYNAIVYNPEIHTSEEISVILKHEEVHITQKHFIDILLSQFLLAAQWFNPIAWLYKKCVTENLEYIADSHTVSNLPETIDYQSILVKNIASDTHFTTAINFYSSLIKKRIVMLNTPTSTKMKKWKLFTVLPFLIFFLMGFQVKEKIVHKDNTQSISKNIKIEVIINKNSSDAELKKSIAYLESKNIKLHISNVNRNTQGEIIAISLDFEDDEGNKGSYKTANKEPIKAIKFFKSQNGVGFMPIEINETEYFRALRSETIHNGDTLKVIDGKATYKTKAASINIDLDWMGITNFNAEPLYIVDGKEYRKDEFKLPNPNSIEKIEILKEESGRKAYGEKGKNGVVIIHLKESTKE